MYSILIRIILRYLAAALVAKGILSPGFADMLSGDPDIFTGLELAIGGLVGVASEAWHYFALKKSKDKEEGLLYKLLK